MTQPPRQRIEWVDYAKGFCIVFVVMMHSTLGVGQAAGSEGWLHYVVAFAQPFRMPDFFLISGLFLAQVIDRDWRTYLDRKVVHFVYFYLLWTAIQFALQGARPDAGPRRRRRRLALSRNLLGAVRHALVHLPAADLLRRHQARARLAHPRARDLAGRARRSRSRRSIPAGPSSTSSPAASSISTPATSWPQRIFTLASQVQAQPETALAGLVVWGLVNGVLVFNGYAELPLVSLALGLAGAAAVVAVSALLRAGPPVRAAALLRRATRSSSISRSSSAWRRAARCCSNTAGSATSAPSRAIVTLVGHLRRAAPLLGRAPHAAAVPVRAAGIVLDRAEEAAEAAARALGRVFIDAGWLCALCDRKLLRTRPTDPIRHHQARQREGGEYRCDNADFETSPRSP